MVAPISRSPAPLSTGRLSPVTTLSSTADTPSVTTPSTGTFSPGRIRTRSPTTTSASGTRVSAPPRTTHAVGGCRSISARIAAPARRMARASIHRPISTSAMTTTEISKYTCSGRPARSAAAGQSVTKAL
jgi:hypothetical protein